MHSFEHLLDSPSFWVAISFFIFILLAWNVIRKAFLNIINEYRNSISSSFGEMLARKEESQHLLQKSIEKLDESNTNHYILNAHKAAKQILDSSKAKIALLKQHIHSDAGFAIKAFEGFVYGKMKQSIVEKSSLVVEQYIEKNEEEFSKIAIKKTLQSFSK